MFELQIALRYLLPKRRSLSTSLISIMSILVISLIVWLVLVFLSITKGIEKNWLTKLTSLHAPIRIQPTDAYFSSYYYQIDRAANSSDYTFKTIGEKFSAKHSDPYDPLLDPELPPYWPKPLKREDGSFLDPVKTAFTSLESLKKSNVAYQDYEITGALLRLALHSKDPLKIGETSYLSQMSYLLSFSEENPHLPSLLLPSKNGKNLYSIKEGKVVLPQLEGEAPVFLPKSYLDSGAIEGDRGTLSYVAPTTGSSQEQKIPVRVVGFYDPGILPIGNKCVLVPSEITRSILAATQTFSPDGTPTNGIFVWTEGIENTHEIKQRIEKIFEENGISSFWKVVTFEEFEFSKDLLNQFQSDRTLFLLIAAIILIVACSNIISLLVLLVNDKKKEIAILLSMGSTTKSISFIFAFCGVVMGMLGCIFGTAAAFFTLKNLDVLVKILSAIQGRAAFNPLFFGNQLPNDFSLEALLFILITTPLLSLIAGLIPAIKASRIRPSNVLRSE